MAVADDPTKMIRYLFDVVLSYPALSTPKPRFLLCVFVIFYNKDTFLYK